MSRSAGLSELKAAPKKQSVDVLIVGGGMSGVSVAWYLATNPGFTGSIAVVERDPSYEFASTTHTNSCIRQQFSTELNIRISQYAADFFTELAGEPWRSMAAPELSIREFGYLYLANDSASAQRLRVSHELQKRCGVGCELLSADDIKARYPFYAVDDLVLGSLNRRDEGYFDGGGLFQWWRQTSARMGVEYLNDEVCGLQRNTNGERLESVRLQSGATIHCGVLINAAGPRARQVANLADIVLPVEPRKRYTYVFAAAQPLSQELPLTIDPSGVHVRSDASYYMAGCAPTPDLAVAYDDFAADHGLWEARVWPELARRIPQFEQVKLMNSWVGHYAYNPFDRNAIVGPDPHCENFFFINGFSGHGLQQAPAMGRGLAELIVHGSYQTLDLSALGVARIAANAPITEQAVI